MNEPVGFHHQDKIRTPLSEWVFMAAATATMLIGLPVLIAALFVSRPPLEPLNWLGPESSVVLVNRERACSACEESTASLATAYA